MSTSKKRRKAREWMTEANKRHAADVAKEKSIAYTDGARTMEREILRLTPQIVRETEDESGFHIVSIPKFPQHPERIPPCVVVPMPHRMRMYQRTVHMYRDGLYVNEIDRQTTIRFKPVEMAFSYRFDDGSTSLRWFNWEPEKGSEEHATVTKAMYSSMSRLGAALGILRYLGMSPFSGMHSVEIQKAAQLVREGYDELQGKLGKFAPGAYVPTDQEVYEGFASGRF